jgi:predicted aspartyl protease
MEADYLYALAQVSARAEKYREAAQAYEDFLRVSKNADDERRARIKGLVDFLRYLGGKTNLYHPGGADSTKVRFELVGNRPIIKLRINGRPQEYRFVLDTGSGISVISDETARTLGVKSVAKGGFAKGIGGDGKFQIIYGFVREMALGDVAVRNVPVYIRKFHSDGIDGYIGLSMISKFLTTVDYGDQTFALRRRNDSTDIQSADGISLPLRLTSSGFLSGEVQVEGIDVPLNFIVDTGASVSVISDEIAAHGAMAPHARAEKMRVIGSAGITEDVPSFLLPKITFGSHSRKSITAIALDLDLINEASGFEQAGILGGNFLRNYRMTFDFKNSKVTFVSINQDVQK